MNIEEQMLYLFELTIQEDRENDRLQKVIHHQNKLLKNKQPLLMENTQVLNLQKKLQAIERTILCDSNRKTRRCSRYDAARTSIYEHPKSFDEEQPSEELQALKKQNLKLQEKIFQLEQSERINKLKLDQEVQTLRKEQQNLIEIKKRYQAEEQQLLNKAADLDQREIHLNNRLAKLIRDEKFNLECSLSESIYEP